MDGSHEIMPVVFNSYFMGTEKVIHMTVNLLQSVDVCLAPTHAAPG